MTAPHAPDAAASAITQSLTHAPPGRGDPSAGKLITEPMISVPLTPAESIAILERRYPGGLICRRCGVLVATQRASSIRSGLTEAERRAYVCAECRQEAVAAAKLAKTRAASLAQVKGARRWGPALAEPQETRRQSAGRRVTRGVETSDLCPQKSPNQGGCLRRCFSLPEHRQKPVMEGAPPLAAAHRRLGRPGRPKKYQTEVEQQQANRQRVRSSRARRKVVAGSA